VKLVVREKESEALELELGKWRERITASISLTEVVRACRLASVSGRGRPSARRIVDQAEAILAGVAMLETDTPVMRDAGRLDPVGLRSLDAIHLAAALSLGRELGAVITYDVRLAAAARQQKLEVLSPN
jgi:predicted nucleic acid-binding protein